MKHIYSSFLEKHFYHLILLLLFVVLANISYAQTGVLDPTFGNRGKVITSSDSTELTASVVVMQPDGKLLVAANGESAAGGKFLIARYNIDGSPDVSFGSAGIASLYVTSSEDNVISLAVQPDGKIVGGGFSHIYDPGTVLSDGDFYLFRLQQNGMLDSTFGTNGVAATDLSSSSGDVLHKIIIKPDGKILAGGYLNDGLTGNDAYGLVQYKPDGKLDSTFGTNGISITSMPVSGDQIGTLALLPNGKILSAVTLVNQTTYFYEFGVMRFNSNGTLDNSFGVAGVREVSLSNFHTTLHDMALQNDGKIVLVGQVQDTRTNAAVVRLDSTGAIDNSFGNGGNVHTPLTAQPFGGDAATTVQVQPDGKILVGGTTDNAINSTDANFALIRYEADGSIDDTFGRHGIIVTDFQNDGDFSASSVLQPDGKVVLVGTVETASYGKSIGLVRYEQNARLYYNSLKGSVYIDNNANGVKDAGEDYFSNATVTAARTGIDTLTISASSGRFDVEVDTGTYIIKPALLLPYYTVVPASQNISHATYFNSDSVSFALQPISGKRDVFVYIIPLSPARPGFTTDYEIVYGNKGTDTLASGTIMYIQSNKVNITSAVPAASSVSGDTLRWNFTNLLPRDTSFIIVHATIKAPPVVNVGDTLISFVSMSPLTLDLRPKDNEFTLREDVVGSYDPNDKNENHAGKITLTQLNGGDYLQYIIRFQNTGTDTAFNVYVKDTLSTKLDWSTMEMVGASHNYSLTMNDGKCLWAFNNLNLVDKTRNEPKSHGYIVYRIKPKATLTAGENIDNTASIYFDYNLPVLTNRERTTVVADALPLKLLAFTAKRTGRTNLLQWSTAQEMNVSHFEVERSSNGREFSKIGIVRANSTAQANSYQYMDDVASNSSLWVAGSLFYRLKMTDIDGRFQYSPVRMIANIGNYTATILSNPVKDQLTLQLKSEKKATLQMQVVSQDGKVLLASNVNVDEGTSFISFNVAMLPAGNYFIRLTQTGNAQKLLRFEKL